MRLHSNCGCIAIALATATTTLRWSCARTFSRTALQLVCARERHCPIHWARCCNAHLAAARPYVVGVPVQRVCGGHAIGIQSNALCIFTSHLAPPLHSRCMERKRSQWARTFASTRAGAWPHIEVASAGNQTSLKFGLHTSASFVCSNAFAHCLARSSFFGCLPLESYSSVGLREAAQDVGPFGVAGLLRQLHVVAISCSSLSHVCERGESLVILLVTCSGGSCARNRVTCVTFACCLDPPKF